MKKQGKNKLKETDSEYIVPEIIANGEAFEMISTLKMRKELYELIKGQLTIAYRENTYLKYFLYPTQPDKGGIPHNRNFKIICSILEYALTETLVKLRETANEQRQKLTSQFLVSTSKYRLIVKKADSLMKPYINNLRNQQDEN